MSKARMYGAVRKRPTAPEQKRKAARKAVRNLIRTVEDSAARQIGEKNPDMIEDVLELGRGIEQAVLGLDRPAWMQQVEDSFRKRK